VFAAGGLTAAAALAAQTVTLQASADTTLRQDTPNQNLGRQQTDLARFFLNAGAGAVVASIWKLDDGVGLRFMPAVHRRFQVHRNAARALREAQLEALGSADPEQHRPEVWAAFEVFGTPAGPD
jgi:CHAT domain-containing protein